MRRKVVLLLAAVFLLLVTFVVGGLLTGVTLAQPAPTPISFGETISDSIDDAGTCNEYTFSADAGDTIIIRLDTTSGSLAEGPGNRHHRG